MPSDSVISEYVIEWEMIGEVDPIYYTPILKSFFEVSGSIKHTVYVEEVEPIPRGG